MRASPTPKHLRGLVVVLALSAWVLALPSAARAAPATTAPTTPTGPAVGPEAQELADGAAMSAKARAVYLATRPTVDDRATFATHCPRPETPDSYLLGCYDTVQHRISVLRLDRPELAGGMVVTAAHEMLHAVHQGLASRKLAKVEPLLLSTYAASTDATLRAEIESYPEGERLAELYARLGTEVAQLPPKLERHYAVYFTDRTVVVAATAAYRRVFADLEAQLTELDRQIAVVEHEGTDLRSRLDVAGAEADRLGDQIDRLRAQGRVAESNELVDPANAAADTANALVDAYNSLVDRHNALVATYNTLALTNQQLVESLKPLTPA